MVNKKQFIISKVDQLLEICELLTQNKYPSHIILEGDLGTGKTTFVRTFINQFCNDMIVSSPTFTLLNIYKVNNLLIHHFDLYRLSDISEVIELGFDEFIKECDYVFIEWADRALDLIPHPHTLIEFSYGNSINTRIIDLSIIN